MPEFKNINNNQKLIFVSFILRSSLINALLALEFKRLNYLKSKRFDNFLGLANILSLKSIPILLPVIILLLALIVIKTIMSKDSIVIALK